MKQTAWALIGLGRSHCESPLLIGHSRRLFTPHVLRAIPDMRRLGFAVIY